MGEDAQGAEGEISEPEEDSLAGQMAMMRGGSVKKFQAESEDDDDGSDTGGDQKSDDSSDSDSDYIISPCDWLCSCDTSLYPLRVHILPYSLPFFGRLSVLYPSHIDLDVPEHPSELTS